ncbi:hypothetical protein [Roseovarius sp. Pro17]|uniref:hypothetical protein n=1 Tax=Roseovarius sp. Pro17 TaxID=3108175 RepID=UPI002D7A2EE9|nr:hypothetical protein [Roseovarius sp. Pro17]
MTVTKKTLDDIRKELKRSGTEDREFTSKEIVLELAPVIHEQMLAGAKLMNLYAIVKAKLPPEARLSEATFKKYWRDAREELGLAPIKASGRKGPRRPAADGPEKNLEALLKTIADDTSSDGDVDPDVFWPDEPDDPRITLPPS